MKNTLLISLFLIAYNGIVAQYEEPILPNPKRVNFFVAPDYCDRLYITNQNNQALTNLTQIMDSIFIGKMGFSLGVNWFIPLNEHWNIETGTNLANKANQTIVIDSFITNNPNSPLIPESAQYKFNDIILDVPVKVNFQLNKNKLNYFIGGGLILNSLLFSRNKITDFYPNRIEKNKYTYFSFLSNINLSALLSVGVEYIFNYKFRLRLEPNIQHSILELRRQMIEVHPYSYGIKIGFCVSL